MKIGDLVRDNYLSSSWLGAERTGVIISYFSSALHNKSFKVLWCDGTIGNNVWDYDLRVISESR